VGPIREVVQGCDIEWALNCALHLVDQVPRIYMVELKESLEQWFIKYQKEISEEWALEEEVKNVIQRLSNNGDGESR
jgi:hypothetical protein